MGVFLVSVLIFLLGLYVHKRLPPRAAGCELEPAGGVVERLVEDALKLQEPGDLGVRGLRARYRV
jgi:hypothetical protein